MSVGVSAMRLGRRWCTLDGSVHQYLVRGLPGRRRCLCLLSELAGQAGLAAERRDHHRHRGEAVPVTWKLRPVPQRWSWFPVQSGLLSTSDHWLVLRVPAPASRAVAVVGAAPDRNVPAGLRAHNGLAAPSIARSRQFQRPSRALPTQFQQACSPAVCRGKLALAGVPHSNSAATCRREDSGSF